VGLVKKLLDELPAVGKTAVVIIAEQLLEMEVRVLNNAF